MRKFAHGATVMLLLALVAWAGGDPWKQKPYQQWDEKEVHKVLFDSPWAKLVTISVPSSAASDSDESGAPSVAGRPTLVGGGTSTSPTKAAAAPPPHPSVGDSGNVQAQAGELKCLIRWTSARTVREALVRGAILVGKMKEADGEKFLAQPTDEYQVLVAATDLSAFGHADENSLKSKSYLSMKKSKQKIAPSNVVIQRGEDGWKVTAIVLAFPKKSGNGEATIAPDEKSVEFVCPLGSTMLKASFDPQKMADSKGQDL